MVNLAHGDMHILKTATSVRKMELLFQIVFHKQKHRASSLMASTSLCLLPLTFSFQGHCFIQHHL